MDITFPTDHANYRDEIGGTQNQLLLTGSDRENETTGLRRCQAGIVIAKIEQIFESLADCILENKKELVIQLKTKTKAINHGFGSESLKEKSRNITFPSRRPEEAWKFTVLLRILELSHEALVTGVVTTKRDIYYREPKLFKQQSIVDRYLNDIAFTFGVERDALNVVAAAKGLVAGFLKVTLYGCSSVDCYLSSEGKLIPNCQKIKSIVTNDIDWILVIEKEVCKLTLLDCQPLTLLKATFRTITSSLYWKYSLAGKGIAITAKGYPDIQTRQFLYLLSVRCPRTPIYALMDFDPDGIQIMNTYAHGSVNHPLKKSIAIPMIRWLGVKSNDFLGNEASALGLQSLSARDRRLATNMVQREENIELRQQLQTMLMLNLKAEIQILGGADSLSRWLDINLLN